MGRPILYGTTDGFLRYFGLRDLADLPPIEAFGKTREPQEAGADSER